MPPHSVYMIVGLEICPLSGNPHHQGYVYFATPHRFSRLAGLLPGAHLETAKGTAEENKKYCSKDDDVQFEEGVLPTQGRRTDLADMRKLVADGANLLQVHEQAANFQQVQFARSYMILIEPRRDWKTKVNWYYGPTGTGKSFTAMVEAGEDAHVAEGANLQFFDGYDGHEHVVIEEFRQEPKHFAKLLRLFDRYPVMIDVKGSKRSWRPKEIWLTCPFHPRDYHQGHPSPDDVDQLMRRIERVVFFPDPFIYQGNMSRPLAILQ